MVAENVKSLRAEQETIARIIAMVGNGVTAEIDAVAGTAAMVAGTVMMAGTVTAATVESKIIVIGVTEVIVMTVMITVMKEGHGKTVKTAVMAIVGITGMIPGIATAKGDGQIGHTRMRNVEEATGE